MGYLGLKRLSGATLGLGLIFSGFSQASATGGQAQFDAPLVSTAAAQYFLQPHLTNTEVLALALTSVADPLTVPDFALVADEPTLSEQQAGFEFDSAIEYRKPDCSIQSCVALTFDDGPGPHTEALLAALATNGAPATFFVVGQAVRAHPELLLQMQAAGHEIALHSDQHRRMPTLSNAAIVKDFERSRQTLFEVAGIESFLYRPPYGLHSSRVGQLANAAVIMWDVDPQDWRVRNSRQITQRVLNRVQPGSIVVLHELEQTVAALNSLATELVALGYTLVTVSEILGEEPVRSRVYRNGVAPDQVSAAG